MSTDDSDEFSARVEDLRDEYGSALDWPPAHERVEDPADLFDRELGEFASHLSVEDERDREILEEVGRRLMMLGSWKESILDGERIRETPDTWRGL